jgi:hypothetical protein
MRNGAAKSADKPHQTGQQHYPSATTIVNEKHLSKSSRCGTAPWGYGVIMPKKDSRWKRPWSGVWASSDHPSPTHSNTVICIRYS